jgi:hypothetical protein
LCSGSATSATPACTYTHMDPLTHPLTHELPHFRTYAHTLVNRQLHSPNLTPYSPSQLPTPPPPRPLLWLWIDRLQMHGLQRPASERFWVLPQRAREVPHVGARGIRDLRALWLRRCQRPRLLLWRVVIVMLPRVGVGVAFLWPPATSASLVRMAVACVVWLGRMVGH